MTRWIVLTKAWGYQLGKLDLLPSPPPRGVVQGGPTRRARAAPGAQAVVCSSLRSRAAILFLVNIPASAVVGAPGPRRGTAGARLDRGRRWDLPVGESRSSGSTPQIPTGESLNIADNIKFTRQGVRAQRDPGDTEPRQLRPTSTDVLQEPDDRGHIRLWDPSLCRSIRAAAGIKQFYVFSDVDRQTATRSEPGTDGRWSPPGRSPGGIPEAAGTWQTGHLVNATRFRRGSHRSVNGRLRDGPAACSSREHHLPRAT
jgi:hypothetical protein